MKYNFLFLRSLMLYFIIAVVMSCEKLVEVKAPTSNITETNAFEADATAISFMTSLYATMSNWAITSSNLDFLSLSLYAGLGSDELDLWEGAFNTSSPIFISQTYFYTNDLASKPGKEAGSEFWFRFYSLIYSCNQAINKLERTNQLTSSVSSQLLGEAFFLRAYTYFYLTNLYGDVPIVLTTDYRSNLQLFKSDQSKVYAQIQSDLDKGIGLLNDNYLDGTLIKSTTLRVRPTKWAAIALKARLALYTKDWVTAEAQANKVITMSNLFDTTELKSVFLANSKEAIWQIQPVITGWNTQDARAFVIPSTGFNTSTYNTTYLSSGLYNSFEASDKRVVNWVGSRIISGKTYYYPFKYKVSTLNAAVSEYPTLLRLGEQYLIRAEAKVMQNKLTGIDGAISDLNLIRKRAGLPPTTATTQSGLLTAVQKERRVEMFSEMGDRWLDLKRTGQIDEVMQSITPKKNGGKAWESYQKLYPIPYYDIQNSPNIKQNIGY